MCSPNLFSTEASVPQKSTVNGIVQPFRNLIYLFIFIFCIYWVFGTAPGHAVDFLGKFMCSSKVLFVVSSSMNIFILPLIFTFRRNVIWCYLSVWIRFSLVSACFSLSCDFHGCLIYFVCYLWKQQFNMFYSITFSPRSSHPHSDVFILCI